MKNFLILLGLILLIILISIGIFIVQGFLFMIAWNFFMPWWFGFPLINLWASMVLVIIFELIFGGGISVRNSN